MDCSLPGSSVQVISQARILEWIAISYLRDLPNPGIKSVSPALAGRLLTAEPPRKPRGMPLKYIQMHSSVTTDRLKNSPVLLCIC